MKYVLRIIALLILAAITGCQSALIAPLNPFDKKDTPFEIKVPQNNALQRVLADELVLYRANLEEVQFSQPRKIAYQERQLLIKKLRSEGYYSNKVKTVLEREKFIYLVEPGPRYRVSRVVVREPEDISIPSNRVKLKAGAPLLAKDVLAGQSTLHDYLLDNHCLFEPEVNYRVLLNHAKHSAEVIYLITESPEMVFGSVQMEGLTTIEKDYLLARLPFKAGNCFKRSQLDKARLQLLQTNLVASISIEEQEPVDNRVNVTLQVTERDHHTVSAGAGFESEEGFGVSVGWEHRNLLGRAEKLSIDGHVAEFARSLDASLTFPHIWRDNQALTVYSELSSENPDAFQSETGTVGVELSRQLTKHIRAQIGGELAFSKVTEDDSSEDYALLSVPMNIQLDYRNNPLDPTSGWVAGLNVRPYWDAYDTDTRFLHSTIAASAYLSSARLWGRPTLALRSAMGTITGIDRTDVPANIRFYSGGGGSVRGYAYQGLGPTTDGEPSGGLSFSEVSLETRLRWGQSWGGVLFLDGGTAYESATPKPGEDLRWGAGFGLRYYTSFAPIRFDIGFPLDKRDGEDNNYQIYISIGQAF